MSESTDPSVGARGRFEVETRECMRARGARRDARLLEQMLADEMRRPTGRLAEPEVDARLAKVDRHQLRMAVGEVQEADVAEPRGLVESLGRSGLGGEGTAMLERHPAGRRDRQHLHELAPTDAHRGCASS